MNRLAKPADGSDGQIAGVFVRHPPRITARGITEQLGSFAPWELPQFIATANPFPAGVSCRLGQPATCHAAFAPMQEDRPPDLSLFGGHLWVHFRYRLVIQTLRTPIEVSGSDAVDLQLQVVLPPGGIFL